MNKESEALARQKANVKELRKTRFIEYSDDFALIEQALKRNEPMRVIYLKLQSNTLLSLCCCPNCYEKFLEPINPLSKQFCGFCGQKLDW